MGKMNDAEVMKYYTLDAVVYRMNIYYPEGGLSQQDIESIINTIKRYQALFPFTSVLFVESTTSNVKSHKTIRTGKPGRPKVVPEGKKVKRHAHIVLIGDNENSAYSCGKMIETAINKRFKCKRAICQSIGNNMHAINFINYCLRQKDHIRTFGDFDFYKYKSDPKLCS